jgi:hypothetical protein
LRHAGWRAYIQVQFSNWAFVSGWQFRDKKSATTVFTKTSKQNSKYQLTIEKLKNRNPTHFWVGFFLKPTLFCKTWVIMTVQYKLIRQSNIDPFHNWVPGGSNPRKKRIKSENYCKIAIWGKFYLINFVVPPHHNRKAAKTRANLQSIILKYTESNWPLLLRDFVQSSRVGNRIQRSIHALGYIPKSLWFRSYQSLLAQNFIIRNMQSSSIKLLLDRNEKMKLDSYIRIHADISLWVI